MRKPSRRQRDPSRGYWRASCSYHSVHSPATRQTTHSALMLQSPPRLTSFLTIRARDIACFCSTPETRRNLPTLNDFKTWVRLPQQHFSFCGFSLFRPKAQEESASARPRSTPTKRHNTGQTKQEAEETQFQVKKQIVPLPRNKPKQRGLLSATKIKITQAKSSYLI